MALKRQQATRLPALDLIKRMRFGIPPYDGYNDSTIYTLSSGCELEDDFTL